MSRSQSSSSKKSIVNYSLPYCRSHGFHGGAICRSFTVHYRDLSHFVNPWLRSDEALSQPVDKFEIQVVHHSSTGLDYCFCGHCASFANFAVKN